MGPKNAEIRMQITNEFRLFFLLNYPKLIHFAGVEF